MLISNRTFFFFSSRYCINDNTNAINNCVDHVLKLNTPSFVPTTDVTIQMAVAVDNFYQLIVIMILELIENIVAGLNYHCCNCCYNNW